MAQQRIIGATPDSGRAGWTLLECLLVVAIMALVFVAVAPLLHAEHNSFDAGEPLILKSQEASFALAHVATAMRQARAVTAATDNGSGAAALEFLACDGTRTSLTRQTASNQLMYGPVGSAAVLARNCTAFSLRCYAADGTARTLPCTEPTGVATVELTVTVADPKGRGTPSAFTTRASLQRTPPSVTITEIMYKPPAALGAKDKNQWVELYNASSQPVDVGGWTLWTKDQTVADVLQADVIYSTGSTVLQPGQYALVTDRDSELYKEFLNNGDFEQSNLDPWNFDRGSYRRLFGGAYSGNYRLEVYGTGWTTTYQDFKISSSYPRARLLVRARRIMWSSSNCRLVIQIADHSDNVILSVYNGPLNTTWTTYTANLASVVNQDVRVIVKTYLASGDDDIFLDAIAVHGSRLPTHPMDCLHLWVNDNTIGNNLEDYQVFLGQGNTLRSVVVFDNTWGGNGDGSTLSRTSPWAPSTEQSSWRAGPYGGTPALPN